MYRSALFAIIGALYLASPAPASAQADTAVSAPQPRGLCRQYLNSYGPDLDKLLADKNPETQLQVRYQSALRVGFVAEACKRAPETNRFAENIAPVMEALKTELATDTAQKCSAIGKDIFSRLTSSTQLITKSPDQVQVTTGGLRRINSVLQTACPQDMSSAFATLNTDFDRVDQRASEWPACKSSREALKASMRDLTAKLNDPSNDPLLAQDESYQPALTSFRQNCGMDENWMADQESSIMQIKTMIEERTPLVRKACLSAILATNDHLEAIHSRSAAFKPGCDLLLALEVENETDKRALDVTFNSTCRLFPAITEQQKERYERELRLIEELEAEDLVMRYRLEKGETDAVTCSK